jgi:sulfate permease, SulP family
MTVRFAVGDRRPTSAVVYGGLRNIFAGSICSVVSIATGLSYAALIFSGPLVPWLGPGIAVTFLSTAVAAFVVALRSSLPFTIAAPDTSTSAVNAALVAGLAGQLVADGEGGHLLEPTLIVMAVGSALAGTLLCGLGLARAGRIIRFVPYPVIGGFLGATGWLTVAGAIKVMTGVPLSVPHFQALIDLPTDAKLVAGAAVAAALFLARARYRSPFVLPVLLVASIAAFYVALLIARAPLAAAQAGGWMFSAVPGVTLSSPWHARTLAKFPWGALPSLSGDLLAVMFVTAISMLLNTTGIEVATRREANLDRDLNSLGIANILSAALGGYVSCVSLSRSTLNYAVGATGRLAGVTMAVIAAGMLLLNPSFLAYVPKCVLGGLLLYLGLDLLYRWLVASRRRLSAVEYASLLAIVLIIVEWDFIAGVFIGVVIGCATFALSAGRVNAIKFSFDGLEYRSSLDRGPSDLALLAAHGRQLQGMYLQSYLFFGTANRLYQHVKNLLDKNRNCRFLVFDFGIVTGIDSSATHSFTQIKQAADEAGVQLVLVNLSRDLEKAFHNIRFLTDDIRVAADLDRALEECENAIIEAHRVEDAEGGTLRGWLGAALGGGDLADILAQHCRRLEFGAGAVIARQGELSDSMHFILEGRVGIMVDMGNGRSVRVRSLGRHTTIGEMGLITGQPRSATIEAEVDSVLYELSAEAYEHIKANEQSVSQALYTYVIKVMAERLSFASRVIGVLKR